MTDAFLAWQEERYPRKEDQLTLRQAQIRFSNQFANRMTRIGQNAVRVFYGVRLRSPGATGCQMSTEVDTPV